MLLKITNEIYCSLYDRIISEHVPKSVHHLMPKRKDGEGWQTTSFLYFSHELRNLAFSVKQLATQLNNSKNIKIFENTNLLVE